MVAARMKQMQSFMAPVQMIVMPMFFISGALFPVANLPDWLAVLNRLDPMTYAVDPMRQLIARRRASGRDVVRLAGARAARGADGRRARARDARDRDLGVLRHGVARIYLLRYIRSHAVDLRGALAARAARDHRAAAGRAELRERPVGRARAEPADHVQAPARAAGRRVRDACGPTRSAAGTSCAPSRSWSWRSGSSPTGGCGRTGSTGSADTWMRRLRNDRSCADRATRSAWSDATTTRSSGSGRR